MAPCIAPDTCTVPFSCRIDADGVDAVPGLKNYVPILRAISPPPRLKARELADILRPRSRLVQCRVANLDARGGEFLGDTHEHRDRGRDKSRAEPEFLNDDGRYHINIRTAVAHEADVFCEVIPEGYPSTIWCQPLNFHGTASAYAYDNLTAKTARAKNLFLNLV